MAILIRPPTRVKKKKSPNAQLVLDRLNSYLENESAEPVKMLCGFWKDQQNAITYQELREMVKAGYLDEQTYREWSQDYSRMMLDKMAPVWLASMEAGIMAQPVIEGLSFKFNTATPGVLNWINNRGAEFVTACSTEQKKAIAALLQRKVTEHYTVDELAKLIRPCVGLTEGDATATAKLYDHIVATLTKDHPRMKPENIRKKALDKATKYAEKKHRQRAYSIAQTEMAFAYNRGADEGVRQAMSQNLLGQCVKKWSTSGDDNVCAICAALDGTIIEMDETFEYKGRVLFPGHKQLPPAHPRCGCAVEYIEMEPPKFQTEQTAMDAFWEPEQPEETEAKKFFTPDEAEEYFGKLPDRTLRRTNREEYDRLREEYNNSTYKVWEDSLDMKESRAISNYAGPDFSGINGLLRGEMTEKQVGVWNGSTNMPVQDMIDHITTAIDKFELKDNIRVYRTCEEDVLESLQKKVGSMFHDNGFSSTTAIREKKASGNIFMEIDVPKGQGVGAWIAPMGQSDEYEFLLQRGTDFLVTGIEHEGTDTIIKMKVTGSTKTQWSYATKEEVIAQWKRKGLYDEVMIKYL